MYPLASNRIQGWLSYRGNTVNRDFFQNHRRKKKQSLHCFCNVHVKQQKVKEIVLTRNFDSVNPNPAVLNCWQGRPGEGVNFTLPLCFSGTAIDRDLKFYRDSISYNYRLHNKFQVVPMVPATLRGIYF